MKGKLTPHIITVTAFVVFIVLGLACASSPSQKFELPLLLTQKLMLLDDPRMPPDQFYEKSIDRTDYWRGTIAPEHLLGKPSFFRISRQMPTVSIDGTLWAPSLTIYNPPTSISTGSLSNVSIDGTKIDTFGTVGLPPGKHTFSFSYKGREFLDKSSYVDLNYSNITIEADLESGKYYYVSVKVGQSTNEARLRTVHGWATKGNVIFEISGFKKDIPTSIEVGENYVYLEPYDSGVPLELQSFLTIQGGNYIVGFNGNAVSWGVGKGYEATIGIPTGKHELQIANLDNNLLYTVTIDTLPQRRYLITALSSGGISVNDLLVNKAYGATESGKFTRPK